MQGIRRILTNFVALEITEHTPKRIVAKDLLNLKEISIPKTVRRIDMLLRTMFQDLPSPENHSLIVERDNDVNRLYFLLTRLLKSVVTNPGMSEELGVSLPSAFSTWYLTINLENLADCFTQLIASKPSLKRLEPVIATVEEQYLMAMKSYYQQDKIMAEKVAQQRQGVFEKIQKCPPGIAENLKYMITLINNIARTVIDG